MKRKQHLIPDPLYNDIKNGHVVLFAGAGISTESKPYGSPTFYENIKAKAKYPKRRHLPSLEFGWNSGDTILNSFTSLFFRPVGTSPWERSSLRAESGPGIWGVGGVFY